MRTTQEYVDMIPTTPPADVMERLQAMGHFTTNVMSCRVISKAQADELAEGGPFGENDEDFRGDFRLNEKGRTALLRCSACGGELLAEYLPGGQSESLGDTPRRVRLVDPMWEITVWKCGTQKACPVCGALCVLRQVKELRRSMCEQVFLTVPTVTQGCLVLTKWCIERRLYETSEVVTRHALESYIVDGKRMVRLVKWRRFMGQLRQLGQWEQTKHLRDNLNAAMMYNARGGGPELAGTALENARLWEYMAQSYECGKFYPVAYIRLYLKHPAVENLVAAGFGRLLGQGFEQEAMQYAYYMPGVMLRAPRLDWINWKQKRPAQMLGLNKQQLAAIQGKDYGPEHFCFLHRYSDSLRFADACTLLDEVGPHTAERMLESGQPPIKMLHYLRRQEQDFDYLADYWRMAADCGMELNQPEVRWPKSLVQAHDRAVMNRRVARIGSETRRAFEEMSARCAGLAWEHDGLCIRPAAAPEELIQEGNTLHHCVGSYIEKHASGKIILFVRHARRPERSWYTLNIDVTDKHEIQLHGYRNEILPSGRQLYIPQEVLAFVAEWRRTVLNGWQLPPAEKPDKNHTKAPADKPAA